MSEKTPEIPKEYIISLKYNSFIWLPAKTASTNLSWIFRYFDFQKYNHDENEFKIINDRQIHLGHSMELPPNHEKFIFICSIRNPYEAIFSYFRMSYANRNLSEKNNFFQKFLFNILKDYNSPITKHLKLLEIRSPDYVIRSENLFEDISKIPFVSESKIYNCGIIEEMCKKKLNVSPTLDFEIYFSDEQKEKINSMYHKIFELGGYNKL